MAVAHDDNSESHTGTTGSASEASFSWQHIPIGTPRGVLVLTFVNENADDALGVTYGGVALSAVSGGRAVDTAHEVGDCKAWFLGSAIPTGEQTVVVTRTNNANVMYAQATTVTAAADTEVTGVVLLQENQELIEQNVDDGSPGMDSVRYAGVNSGRAFPPPAGASSTSYGFIAFGARTIRCVRETTAGQGSRPVGFADASDDVAAVHLAIREVVAGGATVERSMAISAVSALAAVGQRELNRAAAISATSLVALAGQRELERALAYTAASAVTIAAQRELERSAALAAASDVEIAGQRELERAIVILAASLVTVAGQRELERALALSAATDVEISGQRALSRAVGITSASLVEISGTTGTVVLGALSITAASSVEIGHVRALRRSAAIAGASLVQISGSRELARSVALSAASTVSITTSRELLRSLSFTAASAVTIRTATGEVIERTYPERTRARGPSGRTHTEGQRGVTRVG